MAQQSFFFNSVEGDAREYDQNQLALALKHIAAFNGISPLDYEEPLLAALQPNSDLALNAGVMVLEGFIYHNDATLIMASPSYLQGEVRTDRLIVRLDRSVDVRNIQAQIVLGTAGSAEPPELIRAGDVYDMCLALLKWDGASLVIEDRRNDNTECGFIGDEYASAEEFQTAIQAIQEVQTDLQADLDDHRGNRNNPHQVTRQQLGAAGTDPATQTAAGLMSAADKSKLDGLNASDFATAAQGTKADNAVPNTRTINGKALSANISLAASDVGALASDGTAKDSEKLGRQLPEYYAPQTSLAGKQDNLVAVTVTLSASGWSSNQQTVTVPGVTADASKTVVWVGSTPASKEAYDGAGIYASAQDANTLTFTCSAPPSTNVQANVVVGKVVV